MAQAVAAVKELIGEARYFDETVTPDKVHLLLDNAESSTTSKAGINDKVDGMKYLLAMMARGRDVTPFFPDVVRNVVVKSVEVKKLVYNYLVSNADANPTCRELALLAINSFQRDLSDSNQLIRALALRVLCGIRVREIVQIQLMAVKKCATDSSTYVRKTAAHCVGKILQIDPDARAELVDIVTRLLADRAPPVLSSAVAAFEEVCPERLELLHPHYRKLCILLSDLDEWGQITTLTILTSYARMAFTDPNPKACSAAAGAGGEKEKKDKAGSKKKKGKSGFYSDSEDSSDSSSSSSSDSENEEDELPPLPEDHALLLRCSLPLLRSRNTAVVLAVATLHHYTGRHERGTNDRIGRALVRAMRGHREAQYLLLGSIVELARAAPDMFRRYLKDFYVLESEPGFVRLSKLQVLAALVVPENASLILREFTRYVKDDDKEFVKAAIKALVVMANALPAIADRCLRGLMALVGTDAPAVVAEAVVAIRQLLQQHPQHDGIVLRLIRRLPATTIPSARAAIIWVAGEFQSKPRLAPLAPDLLRGLAKGFRSEATEVKLQIVALAAKTALQHPDSRPVQLLFQYVLELSRYDPDYDLRDRARLLRHLLLHSGDIHAVASDAVEEAGAVIGARRGPAQSDVMAGDADALAGALAALEGGVGESAASASSSLLGDLLPPSSPVTAPRSGVMSLALSPGLTSLAALSSPAAASGGGAGSATSASSSRLADRVTAVLLASKPPPSVAAALEAVDAASTLRIGSLSAVVGHAARGYQSLPPWAEVATSPKLRDPPRDEPAPVAAKKSGRGGGAAGVSGGGSSRPRASTSSSSSDTTTDSESESEDEDTDSDTETDTDSSVDSEDETSTEEDSGSDATSTTTSSSSDADTDTD